MAGSPLPVEVVRPRKPRSEKTAEFIVQTALTFQFAWILMLIAGTITAWHPSYWHSVLALIGIRLVQRSDFLAWTRLPEGAKKKR